MSLACAVFLCAIRRGLRFQTPHMRARAWAGEGKARQGKARQGKARQFKAIQGKARGEERRSAEQRSATGVIMAALRDATTNERASVAFARLCMYSKLGAPQSPLSAMPVYRRT